MGSSGSSTTTSTYSPPPEVLQNYQNVVNLAQQAQQIPFTPYGGEMVAQLNPTQQAGISNVNQDVGFAQPFIQQGYQNIQGGQYAAQPYYDAATGSIQGGIAAANPLQQQAQYGIQNALGYSSPYQNMATGLSLQSAQGIMPQQFSQGAVNQYMSPYMNDVVSGTMNELANQQAQQRSALQGQAISAGAFGGDRAGIAQAELANQQNLATGQVLGNLLQSGYGQALSGFQQQQGVNLAAEQANRAAQAAAAGQLAGIGQQGYTQQLGAAQQQGALGQQLFGQGMTTAQQQAALGQGLYSMGLGGGQAIAGLGTSGQTAALQSAQAQLAAGAQQQATQQALDQAYYNQFLQQQAYPFQSTQYLANIVEGIGAGSGGTSATTSPGPSLASTLFGGLGALSVLSDPRMKDNMKPIGETYDGQKIYKFNYKGDPRTVIGLNAAETEKTKPEAVSKTAEGIRGVNYDVATKDAEHKGHFAEGGVASMGGAVHEGMDRQGFALGGGSLGDIPYIDFSTGISYIPTIKTIGGRSTIPNAPKPYQDTSMQQLQQELAQIKGFGSSGKGLFASGGLFGQGGLLGPASTGSYGFATGDEPGAFATGGVVGERSNFDGQGYVSPNDPNAVFSNDDMTSRVASALGTIESGQDYDAQGPVTKSGDRAYGFSQVMGANVPKWTKQYFDQELTPEDYLKNPQAQVAVTRGRVGELLQAGYTPQDVASVWFSGRPRDQAGNASDVTGTTVPDYISRFNKAFGIGNQGGLTAASQPQQNQGVGGSLLESALGRKLDPDTKMALLTGSLGMMASTSPFFGVALGEGGLAAVSNYMQQKQAEREYALGQQNLGLQQQRIGIENRKTDIDAYGKNVAALQQLKSIQAGRAAAGLPPDPTLEGQINNLMSSIANVTSGPQTLPSPTGALKQTGVSTKQDAATTGDSATLPPPNVLQQGKVASDQTAAVQAQKADDNVVKSTQDPAFLAKLKPENNPQHWYDLAKSVMPYNPEQGQKFLEMGRAADKSLQENGYGFGPNQEIIQVPGWAENQALKGNIENTQKYFDGQADAYSGRQQTRAQLQRVSNLLQTYQSGALAEPLADAVRYARSLGFDVPDSATANPVAFQEFVKEQMKNVFSQIKEIGGQMKVAEMKGLEQATANPTLEPAANRAILGEAFGIMNYADKKYADSVAYRNANRGTFDRSNFELQWNQDPKNNPLNFIREAEKKTPVRGATPQKASDLQSGYQYVIEPNYGPNTTNRPKVFTFNGYDPQKGYAFDPVTGQ